jgi:hypothetical protein
MYFLNKFMKVLQIIGFVGGNADPCMMERCNGNGIFLSLRFELMIHF